VAVKETFGIFRCNQGVSNDGILQDSNSIPEKNDAIKPVGITLMTLISFVLAFF
jgi:hypothetical protein